jgi:Tfp pilus assembly protein PilO
MRATPTNPMNWLPKERRNLFIIVVMMTVAVLALIYFSLISSQHGTLSKIAANRQTAQNKIEEIEKTIKNSRLTASQLDDLTLDLSHAETDMASGDLYSWTYATIRQFKQPYKVEIPEIGPPKVGEVELLPAFPYKQITFSVTGKAFYHDLGKFVADFENAFPHARLVDLNITPSVGNGEQLSFSMDIIALVKPNAS